MVNKNKNILWEVKPSKIACKTIRNLSLMVIIFLLIIPIVFVIIYIGNKNFFNQILSQYNIIIHEYDIFVLILYYFPIIFYYFSIFKPDILDKWKNEQYLISDKNIFIKESYPIGLTKRCFNIKIKLKDIYQFKILNTYPSKKLGFNIFNIKIFSKDKYNPIVFLYYIENPEVLIYYLIRVIAKNRLNKLKIENKEPIQLIEWENKIHKKINFYILCKVLYSIGISLLIFGIFSFFYSIFFLYFLETNILMLLFNIFRILTYFLIICGVISLIYILFNYRIIRNEKILFNNDGFYNLKKDKKIIDINDIKYFCIKKFKLPFFPKIDISTILIYNKFGSKPFLKIHWTTNYQTLINALIDLIYIKKYLFENGDNFNLNYNKILMDKSQSKTKYQIKDINDNKRLIYSPIVYEDLPDKIKFIHYFIEENENIIKIIKPVYRIYIISKMWTLLLIGSPLIIIYFLTLYMSYLIQVSYIEFLELLYPIILPLILILLPIIFLLIKSFIKNLFKLINSYYILTNLKIIKKYGKKINLIPIKQIKSISILNKYSKFFSKNPIYDILIEVSDDEEHEHLQALESIFYDLMYIKNPNELKELIFKLKDNIC